MTCKIERLVSRENTVVPRLCGRIQVEYPNTTKDLIERDGRSVRFDLEGVMLLAREPSTFSCCAQTRSTMANKTMTKGSTITNKIVMLGFLALMAGPMMAQEAKVTPLFSKDLTDIRGKELLMIMVEYPPGGKDPIHRHNAHGLIYVLEGSIVMQVKGGKEVTLTPGQTFYEGPDDVHIVGRTASSTKPAKFLVFLVKDRGAPVLVPEK